jgi:hypothetical protein
MKSKVILLNIFFIVLLMSTANSATITSTASGNWSDGATWVGGTVPASTDSVVISSGHTVLFNRNDTSTTCGTIEIQSTGKLLFSSTPSDPKTMQVKGNINVDGTLELVPGSTLKMECETNGQYGIIVNAGGTLKGTGSIPTVLTTISAPLAIGGQSINVVSASGFGVGDIITLGSGASAEGFTISSIAGNVFTLNRKALNAQEIGAEVYKNATVTTSNISPGQKTFPVADVGGIKAGDLIFVSATRKHDYYSQNETEIATVESINILSNSITLIDPLNYPHLTGALIVKINRDCLITADQKDRNHCGYINVKQLGGFKFEYVRFEYLGRDEGWDKYGVQIQSIIENIPFKGCVAAEFGAYFSVNINSFSDEKKMTIISNVFIPNYNYWQWGWKGVYGIHFDRCAFLSNICTRAYEPMDAWDSIVAYNYSFSNASSGLYLSGNDLAMNNMTFANGYGVQCRWDDNLVYNNNIYMNGTGVGSWNGDNNCYMSNIIHDNENGAQLSSSSLNKNVRIKFINNSFNNNRWFDFLGEAFGGSGQPEPLQISLRGNSFSHPSLPVVPHLLGNNESYILLQNMNNQPGTTKVYGHYIKENTDNRFNYDNPTYASYISDPLLIRGKDHILMAGVSASATTEVWLVTYRSGVSNWEVKGTISGLQTNILNAGVPYTSDAGQISLFLNEAAGVREGDQFTFVTVAQAGDTNIAKKILFGPSEISVQNSESSLIVNPGIWLELKGTATQPTMIDYDGIGNYKFCISGEVFAECFSFNQVSSEGIKITATANIHKFDFGTISNISNSGSHLTIDGKDHTFNYLNFDGSGAYDVRAQNDANLVFARSQRGKYVDSVLDTSSVVWDDPVLGYTQPGIIGLLSYNSSAKILTVPFKIKDPNSATCSFKPNSFQYSKDGGATWNSVADSNLSGIPGSFVSGLDFASAPESNLYWNTGVDYANLEANLKVRFKVQNGYVYGNYGVSESIPFNIQPPVITVLSPNGGEKYWGGRTAAIQWTAQDAGSGIASNSISIYYTTGEGDVKIAEGLSNSGSYTWTVPEIDSTSVKIKVIVRDNVGEIGEDYSDDNFTIAKIYDTTPPTISCVRIAGRSFIPGDSIPSCPEFSAEINDDYGLDISNIFIVVDNDQPKKLNSASIQSETTNKNIAASYKFSESEKITTGSHAFKITAADEVGNTSSWEAALFVVGDSIPGLLVYPNPYKLGTTGGVKFDGLTEDIKVRIYDIAGDLVWVGQNASGSASLTWGIVNSSGRQLAPGVYLYVVTTNSGGKQSGKIAIIR